MKRFLVFPFIILAFNALAQFNVITTALPSLGLNADAQLNGTAGIGSVSDEHSIQGAFSGNPAILANGSKYVSFNLNHTPWGRSLIPERSMNSSQIAFGINKNHAFGAQFDYFQFGRFSFSDQFGNFISQSRIHELSLQLNYAFKLSPYWSIGSAIKYATANYGQTARTRVFALDLGALYYKELLHSDDLKTFIRWGAGITNLGNKAVFDYPGGSISNFIPITMQTGAMFSALNKVGNGWLVNNISYQASKYLVPTPPAYKLDSTLRFPLHDGNGDFIVSSGKNPDVPVVQGVVQSFYDAPGITGSYNASGDWEATAGQKMSEEWNEIIHHFAHEIRLELSENFSLKMREGLFLEANSKGGRKYFSFAPGIELYGFRFDYSRWIAFGGNSILRGTQSFSIGYHRKFG